MMLNQTELPKPKSQTIFRRWYWIPLAALLILGGLLVAFVLTWQGSPPVETPSDWKTLGSSSARVVIQEYGDFQCSACRAFHERVLPLLIRDYVSNGKVRFEFHHFLVFSGRESIRSAEASECAGEQGQFWSYHDGLFDSSPPAGKDRFSDEHLQAIATGLKLDTQSFTACLTSSTYNQKVIDAQIQANALNLPGTPSLFVNGVQIADPFNYAKLQTAIEAALKQPAWWPFQK